LILVGLRRPIGPAKKLFHLAAERIGLLAASGYGFLIGYWGTLWLLARHSGRASLRRFATGVEELLHDRDEQHDRGNCELREVEAEHRLEYVNVHELSHLEELVIRSSFKNRRRLSQIF
jgi:hypothetical protein